VRVGLRISVATARGARDGVPRLLELLKRNQAAATVYFNLGPSRLHRFLPGRQVAARASDAMRAAREAGCDIGVYGWDPVRWPHRVGTHGWVEAALARACEVFERVAGEPPRTHAAPGWRTSRHALRLMQRLGFEYASDTRGRHPFMPVCEAELSLCPQLPTTLPTLDELTAPGGAGADAAAERVLAECAGPADAVHVFAFRAEALATPLARPFEHLVETWRARNCEIVSLRGVLESIEPARLPRHVVATGERAGGMAPPAVQGAPFLA
jgi:peptidoglycan/xylan/chitin deacetylase (PgdA/CDA1 family)